MQATLERLRARRDERGDEGGFTLIELLIVIVILAILAAIVVFAVQNLTGSSAKASCESDVSTVDHAIQAYVAQVGTQPTTVNHSPVDAAKGQLMPTAQFNGSNGDPVGPWLHSVPTNGTHYSVVIWNDGTNSFPAVIIPGDAAKESVTLTNATPADPAGWGGAIVFEGNGTAGPATGTVGAVPGHPAIATSPSGACASVSS